MEPQLYKQLAEIEDTHWWHQSRRTLTAHYLKKMKLPPDSKILDIGCGTGGTTKFLEQYGTVVGIDKSAIGLKYARQKSKTITFVEGDINDIAQIFPPDSFQLVTLFNVLCHQWIKDEVHMLSSIKQILQSGGYILLTEPAYKFLFREHDSLAMARTRYTRSDFKKYFAETGFQYDGGQYFNALTFPICLFTAFKEKFLRHKPNHQSYVKELVPPPKFINTALQLYMGIESYFLTRIPLPVGVTLLAVGKKP